MAKHEIIFLIFIIPSIAIGLVSYYIYRSTLQPNAATDGVENPTRKRFYFFLSLFVISLIMLSVTIPKSPYYLFADGTPSTVIYVAARQYSYTMSDQEINRERPVALDSVVLPLNELVEFRVTSFDVNHGFGIYNDKAELVTQTQAMPGYVNRLRWKFTEPGHYNILCLEYCGMAHAGMRGNFIVK